ncbi:MAG: MOSC N-terminal beta barrel domain-containing protein [Bacteroidota bacterium]
MPRLQVSEINIYPVKSLGGISVSSATVMKKGLEHDRRWMLIDEENIFLTQRIHHRMALFRMSFGNEGFQVCYDSDCVNIPSIMEGDPVRAKIWDDEVTVSEVSTKLSDWFSQHLGIKCRLVAFPEENDRPVDVRYRVGDDHVSLADAYPLLVVGQRSLDDLNNRLEIPLPMNRFRPSVVFTGGEPFEEDHWEKFTMNNLRFAGVKLCKRCVLTTIDQATGQKGIEPLVTLAKYRRKDGGVYFGQNVIPIEPGKISIGDEIIVNSTCDRSL